MQIFYYNRLKFDYKKSNQVELIRSTLIEKKIDFDYLRLIIFNRKKSNSLNHMLVIKIQKNWSKSLRKF